MDAATATVVVGAIGFASTLGTGFLAYRAGATAAREETRRLREQHREDERRNRQGTYHQVIALVNRMLWADDAEVEELIPQWHFVSAGVALFGAPKVVERMRPLGEVVSNRPKRDRERWRADVIEAARNVARAMREDIGTRPVPSVEPLATATVDPRPS